MSESPKWQIARLDDIECRGRDISVREHLVIRAFGINAYTPGEDGTLIGEHDESESGQEELYIVLDGNATFEVDGEAFDAPAGTFVFVRPESRRTAPGDGTVLDLGGTPGESHQAMDWGEAWAFHSQSMRAYSEQRYADALEAVRAGLQHTPDDPGLHYNCVCFATLAGDISDETFGHLRRSVELFPRFREQAPKDDDFAPYATTRGSRRLFAEVRRSASEPKRCSSSSAAALCSGTSKAKRSSPPGDFVSVRKDGPGSTRSAIRLTSPLRSSRSVPGAPRRSRLSRTRYAWVATRDPDPSYSLGAAIQASSRASISRSSRGLGRSPAVLEMQKRPPERPLCYFLSAALDEQARR